jgi:hypothetical protein
VDKIYPLQQNPILKEKVYIHTNKTAYFLDDTIWFKAYVGDTINYPSLETTKLNVNMLDASGTIIYDKKVFIDKGMGQGEFELSSAVPPGKYYIQAYTNYMQNFGDEYHYLMEVTVLGNRVTKDKIGKVKYDVQLLPEGGHLLEDIENVMGIKAMINGKGIDFSGEIVDNDGKTIASFANAHLGMAQCKFPYKRGEQYTARIAINDTLLKISVPKALRKGVVLHTDNSDNTYLNVILKTNEKTFYDQVYSNYTLLFHQDHQIYGLVSVARLDSTVAKIKTDKSVYLDGVNTVTLFEDDRPIAERKFFVEKDYKKVVTGLDRLQVENDSTTYKLRLVNGDMPVEANLSVSVLTEDTKAYVEKQNLRSSFLLTPFLKGTVENAAYYLNAENKKSKEHLDLLLLTQGWSQYTLKEMIGELNPRPKFEFEHGFELKGELEGSPLHNRLALIPYDLRIMDKVALKGQSKFVFQNLNIFKGDTVRVAYQNWLGKIIKPSKIKYDTTYNRISSKILIPVRFKNSSSKKNTTNVFDKTQKSGTTLTGTDTQLRNLDGTIDLNEVIVTDKKLSQRMIERRKLIEKYKPMVFDIGRYYDLPVPENFKEHDLMSFLRITEDIQLIDFQGPGNYLLTATKKKAFLFIDGRIIDSPELPTLFLSMEDVENVMVAANILRPFSVERITIIRVFTSDAFGQNKNELFDKFVIVNGFDRAKKYYTPRYIFDQPRPIGLLEVDWKPHLKTDKKGEVVFKIAKNHNPDRLMFSIQGFSEEGNLISKVITK